MTSEAIILAGGLGTRLKGVVQDVPKPMAPVNGKPFLHYLLSYLFPEGIKKVILSLGYKHEIISGFFGDSYQSIKLEYSVEEYPLGTGGAISLALQKCKSQDVFILNGDSFFPINLKKLHEKHLLTNAETIIALKKIKRANRYGTVNLGEDSFIKNFEEKKESDTALINGGIYLLNQKKFTSRKFNEKFSFEKDYLETTVHEHCIAGLVFNTYFLDIGIPESFQKAQKDFKQFV